METNFSEKGYIVIRKAINSNLFKSIQNEIYSHLRIRDKNQNKKYDSFCKKVNNLRINEWDFTKPIFELLHHKKYLENIFLEKKLFNLVSNILGRDLAYCSDPGANLNLPKKSDPKKNYFFKGWHQEIWSGASPSTLQFWTPLVQKNSRSGQIELIESSHKWGHIPHNNRQPIKLPKKIKTKKLNLDYGDVIIFSTLLVHRSVETNFPRLALPCLIKNFKNREYSFETNRNFQIFSYSEMTKIERILGNHYLSPFRINNLDEN